MFETFRSDRRCAFLLFFTRTNYGSSTPLEIKDISGSLGRCHDDRFDSNPSWPGRLCLHRMHRTVRHNCPIFLCTSHKCRRLFDPSHSKSNSRAEWKANRVPITRTQLSRMEVVIPDVYEQDETPKMSQQSTGGSLVDVEGRLYGKPAGQIRFDENVENGMGPVTEGSMT